MKYELDKWTGRWTETQWRAGPKGSGEWHNDQLEVSPCCNSSIYHLGNRTDVTSARWQAMQNPEECLMSDSEKPQASGGRTCQGPTELTVWKAAGQKMTCGSWGRTSWTWASKEPWYSGRPRASWLQQEEHQSITSKPREIFVFYSGAPKEDGARFFSLMPNDRTGGDNQKPFQEIPFECKKNSSAVSAVKHWNRLRRVLNLETSTPGDIQILNRQSPVVLARSLRTDGLWMSLSKPHKELQASKKQGSNP